MEKETEKRGSTNNCTYTWPSFPNYTGQNDHIGTNISYVNPMPNILALEVKDTVLFYYIKDSAIYYAIYEKGSPIVFKWAYDLSEIFKTIGLL